MLDENNFLRSWSNRTYLWYDEIVDRDPSLYNDPLVYFDLLRTEQVTPSGQPKDKFHFTYDTEEWERLSQSGVTYGYGAQWALFQDTQALTRELIVAYTEPNSPATNLALPLERGAGEDRRRPVAGVAAGEQREENEGGEASHKTSGTPNGYPGGPRIPMTCVTASAMP